MIDGQRVLAVIPARGGDIIKLFLTKTSIPNSSYPAVGASFSSTICVPAGRPAKKALRYRPMVWM